MKSGKIWGTTELLEHNPSLEFHRIEYKAGYCCSEHYHDTKWNAFYVESGILKIIKWTEDGNRDETELCAGEYCKVPPRVWHQFVGVEDGIAFELYWAEFDAMDIVRRTTGRKL